MLAVLTFTFATQSCSSVKPLDKAQLENQTWALKTLNGEDAKLSFTGKIPDLKFDFSKNTVSGNGGCNGYGGDFTLNEQNVFSAPNLVSTMMACMDANKEPEFFKLLSTPDLEVNLTEDSLLTFSQGDKVVLEFQPVVSFTSPVISKGLDVSPENLSGKWNLTSIAGEDMAALFPDKVPTMEIADGKVSGNAGCNNYRCTFKLQDNVITFGPAMATKMACPALKGETTFLSKLATPLQVSLNENGLVLMQEGNEVLTFARVAE
ncbi:META domain-containing protein [Dysgonomonas sp. 521]|uniref:META domain-containing protein n=1 Tax=Dysgonomonas sp. 521 TaxID=2302932 RepID=UPI002106FB83|nr:META domain-containing protein [Dysgonomonas sp. 521]